MREPDQDFDQEDAVPNEVIEFFSKYEIRLEGRGVVAGEASTFLVLDPKVTILAHKRVPDSHPEAATHYWAALMTLPAKNAYRTLFWWNGSFLFLLVRPSWKDFFPNHSDLIRRACKVEEGLVPAPSLPSARLDFERFLAKHREVHGPRNPAKVSGDLSPVERNEPDEMRLIREYQRLATICMQNLERIPS
jgi:hypothetical protein